MHQPAPRFCSNCGSSLHAGASFCGNCGAQVISTSVPAPQPAGQAAPAPAAPQAAAQPQPVPQPAPAQPEEPILETIASLNLRKGLFGRQTFLLFVTPRRLVLAAITSEQLKWAADQAKENARQQGKGFLKQWGAVITSINFLVDTYRAMPVATDPPASSREFFHRSGPDPAGQNQGQLGYG